MRKIKSSIILLLFSLLFTEVFAQELDFNKVISDIEQGKIEKARILLVSIEKDNPSSPTVKYLKAILSEDGNEAAKLYREVVFSEEETDLKDDALFKLYQYYYSRGEFSESDKYARMLKESFPNSEFVNLLKRETLVHKIKDQQNLEKKILKENPESLTQPQVITPSNAGKCSIQVGAFSSESNAQKFAAQFSGYLTKIREKEVAGKKFFVVLVGEFENEVAAKNEIPVLKSKFNIDGMVVNSW